MTMQLRLGALAGLAIVVLAAAATPVRGEMPVSKAILILAIVAPAAIIPALLVRYATARRWVPLLGLTILGMILSSAAIGLLVGQVNVKPVNRHGGQGPGGSVPAGGSGRQPVPKQNPNGSGHVLLSTGVVVALVVALAAIVVVAIIVAMRRQPPPAPVAAPRKLVKEEAPEEIVRRFYSLIGDTLDDLRAAGDPRAAVIAAYARMENGLGQLGVERLLSETPFEYLARVLDRLSVSDAAARELTDLFEQAKFGAGAVDETMKERAIAALEAIREEARAWR